MQRMMAMMGLRQPTALTNDQKTTLQDILSKYDPKKLTTEDAQSIFEQLAKAGIKPGKGMKEAIESAGFDVENLLSTAMAGTQQAQGMQGPPPPPPQQFGRSNGLSEEQISTVSSILSKYDPTNVSASDAISIFKELKDAGITPQKGLKGAIEAAGFNADQLRSTAMNADRSLESTFWVSQNTSQSVSTSALQSLKSILDQYDLTNLTTEDQNNIYSALQGTGLLQSGSYLQLGGFLNTGA